MILPVLLCQEYENISLLEQEDSAAIIEYSKFV